MSAPQNVFLNYISPHTTPFASFEKKKQSLVHNYIQIVMLGNLDSLSWFNGPYGREPNLPTPCILHRCPVQCSAQSWLPIWYLLKTENPLLSSTRGCTRARVWLTTETAFHGAMVQSNTEHTSWIPPAFQCWVGHWLYQKQSLSRVVFTSSL